MQAEEERAVTMREVASLLNVKEKTVYRLAQRREPPDFKVAGAWRFQRKDLNRWVECQKRPPAPQVRR